MGKQSSFTSLRMSIALKHFASYVGVISTNWSVKLIELVLGGVVSSNHFMQTIFHALVVTPQGLLGKR